MRINTLLCLAVLLGLFDTASSKASYSSYTPSSYSYSYSYYTPSSSYSYSYSYSYNYNNGNYHSSTSGNPIAFLICFPCFIILFCVIACCGKRVPHDDGYGEHHTQTTTVIEHIPKPQAAVVFPPGFMPPVPAMCSNNHPMTWMNQCPYPPPAVGATCDSCNLEVNVGAGFFHCYPCGGDLCQPCGQTRMPPVMPGFGPPGHF